jgi:predicted peptidase
MKNLFILGAALLLSTAASAQNLTTRELTVPKEIAARMPRVNMNFILKTQDDLPDGEKSPLLIWMHGGGAGAKVNGEGWPRQRKFKYLSKDYPFAVLYPQAVGTGWDGESMEVLVKYVLENFPIDPKRVYLSGSSMGGAGTWLVANHNPDLYAALVPCMGGGRVREEIVEVISLERLKHVPIWAFSGRIDKATPIEYAIELEEGLKANGGNIRHTIYEDMGHQGPADEAFNQVETYTWLMSYEKGEDTSIDAD